MTKTYPDSAENWLAFLLNNEATEQDLKALDSWRRQDPQNGFEFDLLQRGWETAAALDPVGIPTAGNLPTQTHPRFRNATKQGLALAAVLTMALGLIFLLRPVETTLSEHRTAKGEQQTLQLEDGTRILLNTDTTLGITSNEQTVHLQRGEAFFKVAPQDRQRFSVTAGKVEIHVLGTEFNVLSEHEDVVISVPEGRVQVRIQDTRSTEHQSFELSQGQTLEIRGEKGVARFLEGPEELRRVEAWRKGKIELDKTSLSDAVKELSRYTPVSVEIAEPVLEGFQVSGVFHIDRMADLDMLIFAIESSLPVEARRHPDKVELFHAG